MDLYNWDFMYCPPPTHLGECTCERCHQNHLDGYEMEENAAWCFKCADWLDEHQNEEEYENVRIN